MPSRHTQILRLRVLLNFGELETANCTYVAVPALQAIWSHLKELDYGSHHAEPLAYRGALFLPHEVGPDLQVRPADQEFESLEGLLNEQVKKVILSTPNRKNGSDVASQIHVKLHAGELISPITKREQWKYFPDSLRCAVVRLERAINKNGAISEMASPSPKLISSTHEGVVAPRKIEAAFVPNDLQRRILSALDGRALKKQKLADDACGGEGTRLYRKGGIKELRVQGLVGHKHGLGYYRPDKPPA